MNNSRARGRSTANLQVRRFTDVIVAVTLFVGKVTVLVDDAFDAAGVVGPGVAQQVAVAIFVPSALCALVDDVADQVAVAVVVGVAFRGGDAGIVLPAEPVFGTVVVLDAVVADAGAGTDLVAAAVLVGLTLRFG